MEAPPLADMRSSFAALTAPRNPNARHRFLDMLGIALCAVIRGADGGEESAEAGSVHATGCEARLALPHGLPSQDPFRRVLARLAPETLTPCFRAWTPACHEATDGASVAIDGQTLRRSCDRAASQAAMPMVSAWVQAQRLGLGQRKGDEQSKDITAIPPL
jgi:hypothetical protein